MKKRSLVIITVAAINVFAAHDTPLNANEMNSQNDTVTNRIKIKISSKTFTATLYDNETVKAFKALLPLTLKMKELINNEKFGELSVNLPVKPSNPGTIQKGDMMLWGSNTLVLFYKTFSTSYSYTKLGSLDDPDGLVEALGSGSVKVKFELE